MKTTGNKVIIEIIPEEQRKGFWIPPDHSEPRFGIVKAIGVKSRLPGLEVGMKVMTPYLHNAPIQIDGKDHLVLEDNELLGIVE